MMEGDFNHSDKHTVTFSGLFVGYKDQKIFGKKSRGIFKISFSDSEPFHLNIVGHGTIEYSSECIYQGEMTNMMPSGFGIVKMGEISRKGEFKNGQP